MRILLTNDDGFNSEGLQILEKILCSYGHDVYVIAPSTQQSSTSHSITLRNSVKITNYSPKHYHITGTPADCILYANRTGLFTTDNIDLVISGINEGANASSDIIYSGTLGAARQAVLVGFKAMAISCSPKNMNFSLGLFAYEEAADFIAQHITQFIELCSPNSIVNINVPGEPTGKWIPCGLSFINYHDHIIFKDGDIESLKKEVGNSIEVKITGDPTKLPVIDRDFSEYTTDFEALENNIIAVSVINVLTSLSSLHEGLINLSGESYE